MDWGLKASPWDFTNDHDPRFAMLIGSNSLGPNKNGGDFSVDLKLGRLDDVGDDNVKLQKSPLKRARPISGTQNITCLVDGCIADLSRCREYHRRHRVCETHSKTPIVSVGCKEQRFCQQCSRFHSLTEFDNEKRSCRKRLDGHNRRRRKPQPEAFYLNHTNVLSSHQGTTRLLQFGGSETYPTWPTVPKHPVPQQSATCPISSPTLQKGPDKRFPFLIVNEPERNNHTSPGNVNPNRVHSLLSSPSSYVHQQMGPTALQFGYPAHQHSRSSAIFPQASSYQDSYCDNEITMMSLSPDDLLEKGASQVLPFSWK